MSLGQSQTRKTTQWIPSTTLVDQGAGQMSLQRLVPDTEPEYLQRSERRHLFPISFSIILRMIPDHCLGVVDVPEVPLVIGDTIEDVEH